jgi:hypothetical protein
VKKEPLKYGLLIRFASIPIVIRNYGLAVLPINFHTYMACTFIQSSVTSPFQAYMGSQFTSFIEFASTSMIAAPKQPVFDENGNIIGYQTQPVSEDPDNSAKKMGVYVMILGLVCSLFVGYKIKKKVEEINKSYEESKKE